RRTRAARPDRARRRGERASRRGVCRVRVHHGLPEDAGAVLEEGASPRGRCVGRGAGLRRRCDHPLGASGEEGQLMPPASAFLVVAFGAVLGAWLRWLLVAKFNATVPNLPLGTLIANVGGGFVVGFVVAWLAATPQLHPNVRLFVITGFLGALTTF